LIAYTFLALLAALIILGRERARNILTGLLVTAAILAGGVAWLIVQADHHSLRYFPPVTGYLACGLDSTPSACKASPIYYSLSLVDKLCYSPLGVVTAATLAGVLGLVAFRFLPMTIVIVLGLWYWIFDILAPDRPEEKLRCLMWCGILTVMLGWVLDKRFVNNYGFWVNKLATLGTAAGMVYLFDNQPEQWRFVYFLLNVLGMLVALYLRRSGGVVGFLVGASTYLGYEYWTHFSESPIFPYVLFGVGVFIAYLGYALHRNGRDIEVLYPRFLERWRPRERHEPVFFGTDTLAEMFHH
jgi:hypothetical protein